MAQLVQCLLVILRDYGDLVFKTVSQKCLTKNTESDVIMACKNPLTLLRRTTYKDVVQ
jgi:hypothetical protein